ncbi:hypothetical protein MPRM_42560 [Mycobacterium parmense]|uniref:Uncharacterized protein n=1 Tax=Mycobacterium parmense TaxID=185642 RepID=A0A7I7YYK1_9MYCO|nr:hypothetical protein MPRM_42560 [Mycobacterium parmense]
MGHRGSATRIREASGGHMSVSPVRYQGRLPNRPACTVAASALVAGVDEAERLLGYGAGRTGGQTG